MEKRLRAAGASAAGRLRLTAIAVASVLAPVLGHAFEIDTGVSDLGVRWDNTVRYNIGKRVQNQDPAILANPNLDDGDRNFSKGSVVTNRFDILSELDVVYRRQLGFRVSGAGWYDDAYRNLDNTSVQTSNTLRNGLPVAGELSPYTKRFAKGPSGEILDAFVFGNFDVAGVPVNIKAGQHTVYWGDSFLLGGAIHGVNYGQNPLDIWKGFATPGSEAKELFRPRGGITVQAQPTSELSVAGQWFYQWQPVRIPEAGSYLTIQDAINLGGQSFIAGVNPFAASVPGSPALLRLWRGTDIDPKSTSASLGEFGLSSRWSPRWLQGTLGFYARKTSDNVPQLMATQGVVPGVPAATCSAIGGTPLPGNSCLANKNVTSVADLQKYGKLGTYNTAYGDDIQIYGITLSKNIAGMSFGAELSERRNMPLQSDAVAVLPPALVPLVPGSISTTNVPTHGTPGAQGTTYHGLVNVFNVVPKTPLFDTATVVAELTWMQMAKVTQNAAVYKGRDAYTAIDKPTKNYVGLAINFTPTWFQVFPGVDILAPVTWSQGISGNAAIAFGGNKNTGNWSAGVGADILQRYRVDLRYNGYYGDYSTNPAGALLVANGASASLSDRGWVSLTFKTTF